MLADLFNDKKILIFGYGREGKSSEAFIKEHSKPAELYVYEGDVSGIDASEWDMILKSPGIYMEEQKVPFTSQTELFLNEYSRQVIGVTGTKGKSTTSSLMYEALKAAGKKAILVGNIGKPCFDHIDEIDDETYIVFELSCHQLMHIDKAPAFSIFLNLYPEHLDYYKTVENYFKAKANIVSRQTVSDVALVGENVPEIPTLSNVRKIDRKSADLSKFELKIPGEHNRLNAEFVRYMAVDVLGLEEDKVISGMESFTGLPHRLEYVGEYDGVRYYDDSISTIPEASVNATLSINNVKNILVGGMDRGIDYSVLETFIKEHAEYNFILMYDTGKRIAEELGACGNTYITRDLAEAVDMAKKLGEPGSATVLSPAAASYGFFKNFEERGDRFKELVREKNN